MTHYVTDGVEFVPLAPQGVQNFSMNKEICCTDFELYRLRSKIQGEGERENTGIISVTVEFRRISISIPSHTAKQDSSSHSHVGCGFLYLLDREHPKEAVIYNPVDHGVGDIIHAHGRCEE